MSALDIVLKDRRAVLAMRRFVTRCTVGVLALLCLGFTHATLVAKIQRLLRRAT
jgi:hypothetical protein